MKKVIFLLGILFALSVSPVMASSNYEEPKDFFVIFGWKLAAEASAVVHLEAKPPAKKPVAKKKPAPKPIITTIRKRTPSKPVSTAGWYVAKASQYGGSDGFYYGHFACGGIYYPNVIGVAHKSIKCGTLITFSYKGHVATIRVVDRGPYCCGRSWDFTTRAARLLGFNGIGTVYWKYAKK